MGTGTDVAIESAGITLLGDDLTGIVWARRLSHATMRNVRQNLFFSPLSTMPQGASRRWRSLPGVRYSAVAHVATAAMAVFGQCHRQRTAAAGRASVTYWEEFDMFLKRATAIFAAALFLAAPELPLAGESRTSGAPAPVETSEPEASFVTITNDDLTEKLVRNDFFFVNVHIPYEGEIEGTDAFIPFDKIAEDLDRLPTDRSAEIVLYCRSGRMSEIAATDLAARGFTGVSHLSGGMIDWQRSGHPILNE